MSTTATVSFPCLVCATSLEYAAGSRSARCPICEDDRPLPVRFPDSVPGHLVAEDARCEATVASQSSRTRVCVRCPACTATFSAPKVLDRCPHCDGSPMREVADPVLLSSGRLPFLLDQNAARAAASKELLRHSLLPNTDALTPLYLPWLLASMHISASYEGRVGYLVEEQHRDYGETSLVVQWTQAIGTIARSWENRGGCACVGMPAELGDRLAPWDFAFAEPVTLDQLGDVPVEHIRRSLEDVLQWAVPDLDDVLKAAAREDMMSPRRELIAVHPTRHDERVRLILVPVWMGRTTTGVRYAINARTGEVVISGHAGLELEEHQLALEPERGRGLRLAAAVGAVALLIALIGWLMMG